MEFGIIIKNLVIMGAITGLAFLSQQPLFSSNNKVYGYSNGIKNAAGENVKKAETWFSENVYPRSNGGEGAKTTSTAAVSAVPQKNIIENSVDNTKKTIAQNFLKLLGVKPEELCTAPTN